MNMLKIVSLLLLVVTLASCKRNYADSPTKAPTNISASEGFNCGTLGTNMAGPDFAFGLPFNFTATFTETVSWKIEILGQRSKATKTIAATSSIIDASNGGWTGNHDGIYFFETGETVVANLIISGKPGICTSKTFTITSGKDRKTTTPTFMLVANSGTNTSNFEGTLGYPFLFNIGASTTNVAQDELIRAPEGLKYLRIEGVSKAANGFFVGGIQSRKSATANTFFLPTSWTDPTKLYLNVYVRGVDNLPTGNMPYANLNFECHENDNKNMSTATNCTTYKYPGAGTPDSFCPSSEDSWVFKLPIRHTGWQLFSCKYSDLMPSEDFENGGFGNRKLEPQKICRVQFGLVSSPPFNKVSADIDFACFTYGAPFDPKK